MKAPLFSPGQPVVCAEAFDGDADIPDPQQGHIYQVVQLHNSQGQWLLELREFPPVNGYTLAFCQEAFVPVDPEADEAIAELLHSAFAPQPVGAC